MLQVFTGKSRVIENIERKGRALYLESEAGTIRIWPQDEGIVRISYMEDGEFGDKQGREFADLSGSCNWSHEREGEEIRLLTEKLIVTVNLRTGSIRFWEKEGRLLLAERGRESKAVERFEVFRTVINENLKSRINYTYVSRCLAQRVQ